MLAFNDDSFPKIRRSIVTTSGLIVFVATYRVGIKLPTKLFSFCPKGDCDPVILPFVPPVASLTVLWCLLAYLFVRYIVNVRAMVLDYKADKGKPTKVLEEAKLYHENAKALAETNRSNQEKISEFIREFRDLERKTDTIVQGLSNSEEHTNLQVQRASKTLKEYKDCGLDLGKSGVPMWEYQHNAKVLIESAQSAIDSHADLVRTYEDLLAIGACSPASLAPPITSSIDGFSNFETASDTTRAVDQFGVASLLVVLSMGAAVWTTLHYFGHADYGTIDLIQWVEARTTR